MKNQTSIFIAVCIICFLFYRCSNSAVNTPAGNHSTSSAANMYDGYAAK
jgi:hypothetical protein